MNETNAEQTSPEHEPAAGSRAWLIVVVVVLLLVYPAARWVLNRRAATPAATPGAAQSTGATLQTSLVAYQAGRYQEAIDAAKAVLSVNPQSPEAYNNIAVSYLGLKKYDEAIAAAQEALRIRPDMQLAKNNLIWIQQEKAKASRPALSADATAKLGQFLNAGLQQTQAKQYQPCIESSRQAIAIDAFSARAYNNLGFCQALLGQWDEGIKSAQKAVELDAGLQIAKNNLAWMIQEKAKALGSK